MGTKGRRKGVYTEVEKVCEYCGKAFTVRGKARIKAARFCSISCAGKWQHENNPIKSKRIDKVCENCGETFKIWPHENRVITKGNRTRRPPRFCCTKCRREWYSKNTTDLSILRERAYDRDGGRCVDCDGRRYLETHHVDGDPTHNVLENLVTVCKKCHIKRHVILSGGYNPNGTRSQLYNV